MEEFVCRYCCKNCKSKLSLSCHEVWCPQNPERKTNAIWTEKGRIGSNQYKKYPDVKPSQATKEKISALKKGHKLSEDHKRAIQQGMKKAVAEGRQRTPKPGGVCNKFFYRNWMGKEECLQGSWELKFAQFLDAHRIKWEKPANGFTYIFDGQEHLYFPDFYLPDWDLYVEVKGYKTVKDAEKWRQFSGTLLIVQKPELDNLEEWLATHGPIA